MGFPSADSNAVTVLAAGSPCLVQETFKYMLRCVTSEAIPSGEPFAGTQGVRRLMWKKTGLTASPSQALSVPDALAEVSEDLQSLETRFDDNAEPFVQTLNSIITLPNSGSGNPFKVFQHIPLKKQGRL